MAMDFSDEATIVADVLVWIGSGEQRAVEVCDRQHGIVQAVRIPISRRDRNVRRAFRVAIVHEPQQATEHVERVVDVVNLNQAQGARKVVDALVSAGLMAVVSAFSSSSLSSAEDSQPSPNDRQPPPNDQQSPPSIHILLHGTELTNLELMRIRALVEHEQTEFSPVYLENVRITEVAQLNANRPSKLAYWNRIRAISELEHARILNPMNLHTVQRGSLVIEAEALIQRLSQPVFQWDQLREVQLVEVCCELSVAMQATLRTLLGRLT